MELTSEQFWNDYWSKYHLPSVIDRKFSADRCLAKRLKAELQGVKGEVLEVGCAPGKWLEFMSRELGLTPSGIEYSAKGVEMTKKNFELLKIQYGTLWNGDFFELAVERQFDVVISLGFIEHFDEVDRVIERHLQWLKPGGSLVLGVPNFRGIHQWLQARLDPSVLDKHNLSIMEKGYFRSVAEKFNLQVQYLDYLGSFEPALPFGPKKPRTLPRLAIKAMLRVGHKVRRWSLLDGINSPWLSSYLLGVFRKGNSI